jgi:hypothetical protein
MAAIRNVFSKHQQQPNTNRSASPASLTWRTKTTDSESESGSLSEFRALPLPIFTDAETDSDTETATDAVVVADKEKPIPDLARDIVETRESQELAREIAAAVDLPARKSREQILRMKKREEMERDNRLLDEIDAMFRPTWKGEESESESEEER